MDARFEDIKIIAWDMDTTLYQPLPELARAFLNGCVEEVARVKKLSLSEAQKIFNEERSRNDSSTQAMINLEIGDPQTVFNTMWEIQKRIGKVNYLQKDSRLPLLFEKLKKFRHFIISNSVREEVKTVLGAIGLSAKYFEKIITVDDTGKPKPDPAPFKLLLKITGLPADQHLYIGDREKVDIIPAKKLGMKTILVWGTSSVADVSLPTVYDVVNFLV